MDATALPIPPLELRELVGRPEAVAFDNPSGAPLFAGLPDSQWRSYLDFGCGCGRTARRLAQQHPRPERYLGLDLHAGMVRWCQENLEPSVEGFRFVHHDVFNPGLNPDRLKPWAAPFPVSDGSVSLVEATSVFTHLIEGQAEFYLDEIARVLTPDGVLQATFFLFDRRAFPFLQPTQNALYVNPLDPTNAVILDRAWLLSGLQARGLALVDVIAPELRGFHWHVRIARVGHPVYRTVQLPADDAPFGHQPPPLLRAGAASFGLGEKHPEAGDTTTAALRAELPTPDPLARELAGAKEYIASLEHHLEAEREQTALLRATLSAGAESDPG